MAEKKYTDAELDGMKKDPVKLRTILKGLKGSPQGLGVEDLIRAIKKAQAGGKSAADPGKAAPAKPAGRAAATPKPTPAPEPAPEEEPAAEEPEGFIPAEDLETRFAAIEERLAALEAGVPAGEGGDETPAETLPEGEGEAEAITDEMIDVFTLAEARDACQQNGIEFGQKDKVEVLREKLKEALAAGEGEGGDETPAEEEEEEPDPKNIMEGKAVLPPVGIKAGAKVTIYNPRLTRDPDAGETLEAANRAWQGTVKDSDFKAKTCTVLVGEGETHFEVGELPFASVYPPAAPKAAAKPATPAKPAAAAPAKPAAGRKPVSK